MKKILITGAGGFIGSHLAELCVKNGYSVRAFVHYNSRNFWGWLEESPYKNEMEIISGDIRDYDSVISAVKGVRDVFHLAALIGIPYSYVSPLAYVRTNIEGTYNVLQATREFDLENVLITSTSETYGTAQYVPIGENHPLAGQSPYAATKIGADHLALSYYRSFDLPVKVVRPFNTYGPRQSARAIIPTVISQVLAGAESIRVGNTSPTRDLTFVEDTVNGYLEIYKFPGLFGEVTNIGTGMEISIGQLVQKILNLMKADIRIESEEKRIRPSGSEVERLLCDNAKLVQKTGWKPRFKIEEGLSATIEWFKENIQHYKAELYNL